MSVTPTPSPTTARGESWHSLPARKATPLIQRRGGLHRGRDYEALIRTCEIKIDDIIRA